MRYLAFLLACLFLCGPLHAAVSYSQPPAAAGGFLSAKYGVDGSGFDEFVWDSFSVPTTRTLREIQWRGSRTFTDDLTLTGGAPAQGRRFYRIKVVP